MKILKERVMAIACIMILFTSYSLAVPHNERIVDFIHKGWPDSRDRSYSDDENHGFLKSERVIKRDHNDYFRYMRAEDWNIINHRFVFTPNFKSPEDAARSYLSKFCYGPVIGIDDESEELEFISETKLYKGRSSHVGRVYLKFRQLYNNVPVIGSNLTVELNARLSLFSIVARIVPVIKSLNLSTESSININDAEQTAINEIKRKYNISDEDLLNIESNELGIYNQIIFGGSNSINSLVWKFIISYESQNIKEMVLVDAQIDDTIVDSIQLSNDNKFVYKGKSGSICDTYNRISSNMQDTPDNQPSRITSIMYNFEEEKDSNHFVNSGIGNKVAYMLINGESFNGKVINAIGYEKTKNIFDEAKYLLNMNSDYFDLSYALQQACVNLDYDYSNCDEVKNAVEAAELESEPQEYTRIHGIDDKPDCGFGCAPEPFFSDSFEELNNSNWTAKSNSGEANWFANQNNSFLNRSFPNSPPGNMWGFAQKGISDTWMEMTIDTNSPLPINSYLFFNHCYIFGSSGTNSNNLNGGVIEYSIDGGATWSDSLLIFEENGYKGTISSQSNNPLKGRNAFVSKSNGYIATKINLKNLNGKRVRFRFRMGTSADRSYYGWFIDDFQIYTCDMFLQMPHYCDNAAVQANNNGNWNNHGIWSTGRIPGVNDIVKINSGVTVNANIDVQSIKGLCNFGKIISENRDINIKTNSFIYNSGKIWAADGQDGSWSGNSFGDVGDGKHTYLESSVVFNDTNGNIQAGRGGHTSQAPKSTHNKSNEEAIGGDGGNVDIAGDYIRNNGNIGPALIYYIKGNKIQNPSISNNIPSDAISYVIDDHILRYTLPESLIPDQNKDGGNGGVGDNGYHCRSNGYVYNKGVAQGGNGGHIDLRATIQIEHNGGNLGGGNGGFARHIWSKTRNPGSGGNVFFNAPLTLINGQVFGGNTLNGPNRKGGDLVWDPIMIMNSQASYINVDKVDIFGKNVELKLNDLNPGAIQVKNDININVDKLDMVDCREDIFSTIEGTVSLYVNEFKIEGSRTRSNIARNIARVFDSRRIEVYPAEVKYDFDIDIQPVDSTTRKRSNISGEKGGAKQFNLILSNNGPTHDVYDVSVSSNVGISTIPDYIRVDPMSKKKVSFQVDLPEIAGDEYEVKINAESYSTYNKKKSKTINLSVEPTLADFKINYIKNQFGTIEAYGITVNNEILIESYQWDMGDHTILTGKDINHTYSKEGSYKVILTVTDSYGYTESILHNVTIKNSKILILSNGVVEHSKTALVATGLFRDDDIDIIDITTNKTMSSIGYNDLLGYNSVLVSIRDELQNSEEIGNVLGQYLNNNGGIVLASYCFTNGFQIKGNIVNYSPFEPADSQSTQGRTVAREININTVEDHFIFSGINDNIVYWVDESKVSNPVLKQDAKLLASTTSIQNFQRVVASNPAHNNIIAMTLDPELLVSPQSRLLVANSLLYVAGEKSDLSVTTNSLNISASDCSANIDIFNNGDGTMHWTASSDNSWIIIENESGDGDGVLKVNFDKNNDPQNSRNGIIIVSALGALNSPFIITVTQNSNQPPEIFQIPDQVVNEDSEIDIPITLVDAETMSVNLIVFARADNTTLVPDSNIRFSNPGINRTLNIKPAKDKFGSSDISITVNDGSSEFTRNFTLTVNPVNDAPIFIKRGNIVLKRNIDTGPQNITNWITLSKQGPGNENDQNINFIVNPLNGDYFDTVPAISNEGNLTFDPNDNFSGYAIISVYIKDDGGTINGGTDQSEPQLFTIYYADDLPGFNIGANQKVNEDSGQLTVNNWATDIDSGTNDSMNVSFITSNNNKELFLVSPQVSSNGTLIFQPDINKNGKAEVTVILKDNNREGIVSEPQSFIIEVSAINDPPLFSGTNHTSNEDAGYQYVENFATNIIKGPEDEKDQSVSFNIINCSNCELFQEMPKVSPQGTLTYRTNPNVNGSASFDLVISDNGNENNTGNTETCIITIKPVNDPPAFTLGNQPVIREDASLQHIEEWITNISQGPEDENAQNLEFIVNHNNPALFQIPPSISISGDLIYHTNPDAFGTAKVTVQLKDNGGCENGGIDISEEQSFFIQVEAVCDSPSFLIGPDQYVSQPGSYTISYWAKNIKAGPKEDYKLLSLNFMVLNIENPDIFSETPKISDKGTLTYSIKDGLSENQASTKVDVILQYGDNCLYGNGSSEVQSFEIIYNGIPDKYSLTLDKQGEGRIELNNSSIILPWTNTFNKDSSLSISAFPANNFQYWTNEQNQMFSENPLILNIDSNKQLTAIFKEDRCCFEFKFSQKWNMAASPIIFENNAIIDLFPNVKQAYRYHNGTFVNAYYFKPDIGYMLYFDEEKTYSLCGMCLNSSQIKLHAGFNFIGCINSKVVPKTEPANKIMNILIWKNGTYAQVFEITPGFAHWIEVEDECVLILSE